MKRFWHKYEAFGSDSDEEFIILSKKMPEEPERCTSVLCPVDEIIRKVI